MLKLWRWNRRGCIGSRYTSCWSRTPLLKPLQYPRSAQQARKRVVVAPNAVRA